MLSLIDVFLLDHSLLTRGTSGLYFQVGGCPRIQTSAKPAFDWFESWLLIG